MRNQKIKKDSKKEKTSRHYRSTLDLSFVQYSANRCWRGQQILAYALPLKKNFLILKFIGYIFAKLVH
jgi:hypothetical protein